MPKPLSTSGPVMSNHKPVPTPTAPASSSVSSTPSQPGLAPASISSPSNAAPTATPHSAARVKLASKAQVAPATSASRLRCGVWGWSSSSTSERAVGAAWGWASARPRRNRRISRAVPGLGWNSDSSRVCVPVGVLTSAASSAGSRRSTSKPRTEPWRRCSSAAAASAAAMAPAEVPPMCLKR